MCELSYVVAIPRRPELAALTIADPPEAWERLGFAVDQGRLILGGITVQLGAAGTGITGWSIRGLPPDTASIDGLPTTAWVASPDPAATTPARRPSTTPARRPATTPAPRPATTPDPAATTADPAATTPNPAATTPDPARHPNGAIGIDHVVVVSPDFDRTAAALSDAQMPLSRVRDAGGFRQGFRRLGPAILELVENREAESTEFWGLVVIVGDLDALAARLGDRLGRVRPAVQPGRHIATLQPSAGLTPMAAFMNPEPD
jgi:hypothetical protein